MNNILFLTGMPASGKSYWAKVLSQHLGLPFFDLDQQIIKTTALTIPELFAQGESGFRLFEQQELSRLIDHQHHNAIIATGGGTPCFHDNLRLMKASGKIIFLNPPLSVIVQRIQNSAGERPLLHSNDPNLESSLQNLYQERAPIYLQADLVIDPLNISPENFARQLKENFLNNS